MKMGIYWLASYPKSGNTWFRTVLTNYQIDGEEPVDINQISGGRIASGRNWIDDVLGFDSADLTHEEIERLRPAVYRWSSDEAEVGFHKIHDAYTYTEDGEPLVSREATLGAVYLLRNCLDVAVSASHFFGWTIDKTIESMGQREHSMCSSRVAMPNQVRQRLLTWSDHVTSWVDAPGLRCEVVRYEDMLHEPVATFGRALRFLGFEDDSPRLEKAIRFSSFEKLSQQESEKGFRETPPRAERFFRKGKTGEWRDFLTGAQVERLIADHEVVMRRFGYLDDSGNPL